MEGKKDKTKPSNVAHTSETDSTVHSNRTDSQVDYSQEAMDRDRWNSTYGSPRNPSPPPGLNCSQSGDTIGDTIVSNSRTDDDDEETVRELDKDLDNDLCQLWDMSACNDVVTYLLTIPTMDIFEEILAAKCSRTLPRLTEIVIGICGNMVCITDAYNAITKHEKFVSVTVSLLDSTDTPTLTELLRFFTTCVEKPFCQSPWLKLIEEDPNFLPRLTFILSSSTSGLLLKAIADFLDSVLDIRCDFCTTWATTEFVESLVEAIYQIGFNDVKIIDVYLHIFQLLSTTGKGKDMISNHPKAIFGIISKYFNYSLDDDFVDLEARTIGFASAIQLWQILITCSRLAEVVEMLEKEHIQSLLKLLELVGKALSEHKANDTRIDEGIVILDESMARLIEDFLSNHTASSLLLNTLNDCERNDLKRIFNFISKLNGGNKLIESVRLHLTSREDQLNKITEILTSYM